MTKRNIGNSSKETVDKNRRKVIRDGLGLGLAGVTFAGLLPGCGSPAGGDDQAIGGDDQSLTTNTPGGTPINVNGEDIDAKFEVVRFTTDNGIAPFNQTINLSTGFGVPKGCIIMMTSDKFGGNGYQNGSYTIGCSDGTNEVCMTTLIDTEGSPNPAGQAAHSGMYNNQVACRWPGRSENSGARMQYRISVDRFGTDQVVLRIDEEDSGRPEQFECVLIAIGGSDVEDVVVGSANLGTGTNAVPVNTGHATDLFFAFARDESYFNPFNSGFPPGPTTNNSYDCKGTYGFAINDGSNSQMGTAWFAEDALRTNPTFNTHAVYNDSILAKLSQGNTEDYSVSVTSFTSTGVELTPSANTADCLVGYMSVKFARNVPMKIVNTTIPTFGDISIAGIGFQPGFGLWMNTNGPNNYNMATDTDFSLTATWFDNANNIFSGMNNGTSGTTVGDRSAGGRASSAFTMVNPGGSLSIDVEASSYRFTGDGVDFAMSNWPANQIFGRMLLLGVN